MKRRNRGVALIAVLFLSALLTTLLYSFLQEMQIEHSLSHGFAREKQARQLAWSAIEKAIATLQAETSATASAQSAWYDNATDWYEIELGDGVYSMLRQSLDADGKAHFGLADECARINLNSAPREVLMKIPAMTEEIADSILDWRDGDDTPSGSGAENSYYQTLNPPYACKSGNFDSVEELLYVKGVTPELLYGEDVNRNGVLDPAENDGDKNLPVDNADGVVNPGFVDWFTVHSYDRNEQADGKPRVNINTATNDQLQQALGDTLSPQEIQQLAQRRVALGGFKSSAQLMTVAGINPPGIAPEKWKLVADKVKIIDGDTLPGLLNINTAGRKILEMLPGLTTDDIQKMLEKRTSEGADLSSIGWLADVLPPAKIQGFAAFVTTRAYQFRFDAIGRIGPVSTRAAGDMTPGTVDRTKAAAPVRAMRRIQAIWDRGGEAPRLVYVRDISRLGFPYPVSE